MWAMESTSGQEKARLLARLSVTQKIVTCRFFLVGSCMLNFFLGIFLAMQSLDFFAEKKPVNTFFILTVVAFVLSFVVTCNIYEALQNNLKTSRILQKNQRS